MLIPKLAISRPKSRIGDLSGDQDALLSFFSSVLFVLSRNPLVVGERFPLRRLGPDSVDFRLVFSSIIL